MVKVPPHLTQGEGVWCHKSKSLGYLHKCGAANQIAENNEGEQVLQQYSSKWCHDIYFHADKFVILH